jgi:hypothetical protein
MASQNGMIPMKISLIGSSSAMDFTTKTLTPTGGRRYKGGCGETCAEYTGGDEPCEGKADVQY